ncbi:MAG: hypothetical protein H0T42_25400 [Deltaproteobacteria bacterium]|nr:hypothetical protein [Deltaproteobacteria bacterium]
MDRLARRKTFTWIAGATFGVGAILAVPAVVLLVRSRKERGVVPFVGQDSAGVTILGRF